MTTDEQGRIRVRTLDTIPEYGWATSSPGNEWNEPGGYTVEWDDGYEDLDITRWYIGGDAGSFMDTLEAV